MDDARDLTLDTLASLFYSSLTASKRQKSEPEVVRFIRWCGRDRSISRVTGREVEQYALGLGTSHIARTSSQQVRAFLTFAFKQGATKANLATSFKIKKASVVPEVPQRPLNATHLTEEGYARLRAELEQFKSQRGHIADELREAAADKDFRENAPLEAARDHQGMVESKIRELEATLRSSVILEKGQTQATNTQVAIGNSVTLRDLSNEEDLSYVLVGKNEAKLSEGKISVESPVGKALLGRACGEEVAVQAPSGTLRFRIDAING